jgi:mono/diheme cytochrome c family protein
MDMKHLFNITLVATFTVLLVSCDRTRRSPGRAYMPDMAYSVAYETYASTERLEKKGVYYTGLPVPGTVARGDMMAYPLKNDSAGYLQSASVRNPLAGEKIDMKNAERLYLVNCGICHGAKLDGNGPLWKDGNGPYTAAPKNLMGEDMKAMAEGTMFHSVTYGKGQMGSYASQLTTRERWEVIAFVKSKQFPSGASDTTARPAADTAAVATAN